MAVPLLSEEAFENGTKTECLDKCLDALARVDCNFAK